MSITRQAASIVATFVFLACGSSVKVQDDAGASAGGSGGKGGAGTGGTVAGPYDACTVAEDCDWGEIKQEILSPPDCVCLYGCPYLPLSKTTIARRKTQYAMFCSPNVDGQGQLCGVDDCAGPPQISCQLGHCVATPAP